MSPGGSGYDPDELERAARLDRLIEAMRSSGSFRPETPLSEEETSLLRAAALVDAARPGAGEPTARFLQAAMQRISTLTRPAAGDPGARRWSRRQALAAAIGAAVAGAAAGFGAALRLDQRVAPARAELDLPRGTWTTVAMLSQTTPGSPQRFEARGVTGFLHVDPTTHAVSAVSGVCTDQPCILEPSHTGDHLVCPCHGAQFATDGTPMPSEYSYRWGPFPALAHIKTRVVGDEIQVFSA